MNELQKKYEALKEYFRSAGSAVIAFSGGVDSTFLMKVASDVLKEKAVAVTIKSDAFSNREYEEVLALCREYEFKNEILQADCFAVDEFVKNEKDRCYYCKKNFFTKILDYAESKNIGIVCEGSNMDDTGDYRPGMKAVAELGVKSPLKECGLYKDEIRQLSKELGLSTWNKSSFACLATRIGYGEIINKHKLEMIDSGEQVLYELGFKQFRVRLYGENSARIEIYTEDFEKLLENREHIVNKFKEAGFIYVSLDLQGFRSGSMNETVKDL